LSSIFNKGSCSLIAVSRAGCRKEDAGKGAKKRPLTPEWEKVWLDRSQPRVCSRNYL
jgi:hypothetical protein